MIGKEHRGAAPTFGRQALLLCALGKDYGVTG
jgi:hypothetical protein